jgi:hypothetical protein|uniref:Uncharacterized protein n=1 Tax=viral metagenome TaxID=1070528 RepID=A0A6C0D0B5_9ZZZZ
MSVNDNNLFNNEVVKNAIKALSPEDVQRYKNIGKELYGTVNFPEAKVLNNIPPPMAESCAYVIEGIKSGLHPSMLSENEKALLFDVYGKGWWTKYGYVEEDLERIVTTSFAHCNSEEK